MTMSIGEYLAAHRVGTDTILQAARFHLAEQTDDLSVDEMRRQMIEATGDAVQIDALAREMAKDPLALENAALSLLSTAWNEPGGRERIESALDDADKSLPVLEIGLLSMAMMYIAYLAVTRGIRKEETIDERRSDGSFKKSTKREFYGATGPLSQIVRLFRSHSGVDDEM